MCLDWNFLEIFEQIFQNFDQIFWFFDNKTESEIGDSKSQFCNQGTKCHFWTDFDKISHSLFVALFGPQQPSMSFNGNKTEKAIGDLKKSILLQKVNFTIKELNSIFGQTLTKSATVYSRSYLAFSGLQWSSVATRQKERSATQKV